MVNLNKRTGSISILEIIPKSSVLNQEEVGNILSWCKTNLNSAGAVEKLEETLRQTVIAEENMTLGSDIIFESLTANTVVFNSLQDIDSEKVHKINEMMEMLADLEEHVEDMETSANALANNVIHIDGKLIFFKNRYLLFNSWKFQ